MKRRGSERLLPGWSPAQAAAVDKVGDGGKQHGAEESDEIGEDKDHQEVAASHCAVPAPDPQLGQTAIAG